VRAEIQTTGYVLRRDPDDPLRRTLLSYIVSMDPKGALPTWMVNLVAVEQADNAGRFRDRAESGLRGALALERATVLPPLRPRRSGTAAPRPPTAAAQGGAAWHAALLQRDRVVAARSRLELPLAAVPLRSRTVRFCWVCAEGAVRFAVEGAAGMLASCELAQPRTVGAGEVHAAQFVLPPNHSVIFVWDNGKSFFGSRHVHYKFQVEDFDTKEA